MSGYLSYEYTGNNDVNNIIASLEFAGNCFHHTSQWDERDEFGKSVNDNIQDALDACASRLKYVINKNIKLQSQLDKAKSLLSDDDLMKLEE